MFAIVSLLMPIASQVNAVSPIKGLEVNADRTELDKAVKAFESAGKDMGIL